MGRLEERNRKRELQKTILNTIALAGILAVGLVAPNVVGAMDKLGILPNPRDKEIIKRSATRLRKKGWIKYEERGYVLTEEGQKILRKWEFADYKLNRPSKWDKKWRLVIFDIPEKRRLVRDQIRELLSLAGFLKLQDSVWVYPYDCEDIIGLLKTDLVVSRNVLYVIADEIENDDRLRNEFDL